jgi:hypothetical protein|tara:strand:- start:946 stop:1395 length:450 start_codon:yes stop_codon:yes gene_type:complete
MRKTRRSKSRKKLNRTRSAPKRILTSRKKRYNSSQNVQVVKKKGGSKKRRKTKSKSQLIGGAINYNKIYDEIEPTIVKNSEVLNKREDVLRNLPSGVLPGNVMELLSGLIIDQKKLLSKENRAHNDLKELFKEEKTPDFVERWIGTFSK